jgi:hypothetical protein
MTHSAHGTSIFFSGIRQPCAQFENLFSLAVLSSTSDKTQVQRAAVTHGHANHMGDCDFYFILVFQQY